MEQVKILIVEDELIIAKPMQMALEKKGYKVPFIATSGDQALEVIKNDRPDLVLMDIHLKGKIDGITTAKMINRLYPLPIIYITQLDSEEIFRTAKETFPKNYITKPFGNEALFRAIELAIQQPENSQLNSSFYNQIESKVSDGVFVLSTNSKFHRKIFLKDILYIQSMGAYTNIYIERKTEIENNKINVALSSNHVIELLAFPALIRVHNSCYVNIQKIDKLQDSKIFIQGIEIQVSKTFKNALIKRLVFIP